LSWKARPPSRLDGHPGALDFAVISLKKFLLADPEDENVLERVIRLLLQGIVLHTIRGAPEDYAAFQESIRQIFEAISHAKTAGDYLVQAGAAIRSIEDYHSHTSKYIDRRFTEMQEMIGMLTSAITSISEGSNESLRRLRDIEEGIAAAAQIEDVRLIKHKLGECLDNIRRESERQKIQASEIIAKLSEGLERAQGGGGGQHLPERRAFDPDPVTGLPGRPAAEDALQRAYDLRQPLTAVVIVLDTLYAINNRFGRSTGDEVLQAFAHYLAQALVSGEEMFRWSGPALLILLHQPVKAGGIRGELVRAIEQKFSHTAQTRSRVVDFPIAKHWTVRSLRSNATDFFKEIDRVVTPEW
jgi:GGDEF domain-containing protein